jgi:sodium-dependent dicarboxylate transporter 2/3/5
MARYRSLLSLLLGIALFILFLALNPFALGADACKVAAIAALMITWWVSEAMPMPVVALTPLVLFPLMGICKIDEAAAPYANPIIFLFLGGFMIGLAIEKWNLHKRIALSIVRLTGTSGDRIVLGFIISTGFLSMWLSNTATTMMMMPIAMSVIKVMEETHKDSKGNLNNLAVCLLLAIAYASNLGGIATIIGTPPNVAYVAFLEKHNHYTFDFREWMMICTPMAALLLACLYFVMVKWLYPSHIQADGAAKDVINGELRKLGKITTAEQRVLLVFGLTAILWITRDLINTAQSSIKLDDTMIAITGAVLLFIIPSGAAEEDGQRKLLGWHDTQKMAWGILLLFGGGITLAAQLEKAGLIQLLGQWIAGFSRGGFLLVFVVAMVSIFISEVMSNVAQVIVFAPVIAGIAEALHIDPLQLGLAMTLGASCAGMLPMGTPPNAIVFASGRLKLKHMTTTGLIMNLVSGTLISLFCWYLLPLFVHKI